MINPYQPSQIADQGLVGQSQEGSKFSTVMGLIAAVVATPLMPLLVLAASFALIKCAGSFFDLELLTGDQRVGGRTAIWTGVIAVICALSAYFSVRSATHYFANDRQRGGLYLVFSLIISTIVMMIVSAVFLFGIGGSEMANL